MDKIFGHEMQFVEIELDPQESAVAEAGAMMYKSAEVKMENVFGDGSASQQGGMMGLLLGAGKRLLTNESLFITVFTQTAQHKGKVAFAAPYPGTILALSLKDYGHKLICQKDSFLAAAKGVQIGVHFQRKILTGLFGGEGLCFAKLTGPGTVWLQSLPFSRLAGRMLSSAPQSGGRQQDEGSILGGLGNLLGGD
jgi:uncharacterized protein (AIM24 family)